jgi:alcohol dehydrogenase YqhD (iron-dependent ADH family)
MTLTDALAEALLRTVKDSALEVMRNPLDYRHRAQIMWAGSLSHNDLMECGTTKDFATHKLEHELSAMFDVTHGAGLAAIWGSWARFVLPGHEARFARFAVNVMGVDNDFSDVRRTAEKGIEATERFFAQLGMPVNIRELLGRDITDEEIEEMARRASRDDTLSLGNIRVLQRKDMIAIYKMARG